MIWREQNNQVKSIQQKKFRWWVCIVFKWSRILFPVRAYEVFKRLQYQIKMLIRSTAYFKYNYNSTPIEDGYNWKDRQFIMNPTYNLIIMISDTVSIRQVDSWILRWMERAHKMCIIRLTFISQTTVCFLQTCVLVW